MSIRSNGSGDVLDFDNASLGTAIGTNPFTIILAFRFVDLDGGGTYPGLVTLDDEAGSAFALYRESDNSIYLYDGSTLCTVSAPTEGDWHVYAIRRDSNDLLELLDFGDTPGSNTPVDSDSSASFTTDFADFSRIQLGSSGVSSIDWIDGEFRGFRVLAGDALSNAEIRTIANDWSTLGDPGVGTWYCGHDLDAVATGLEDLTVNNRDLSNTGMVDGATDPQQGGDSTAPTLSSASGTATGTTTADLSVDSDEDCDAYVVVTTSATTPSAAQIEAGNDHTGSTAAYSDSELSASSGTINFDGATGLSPDTQYWAHFWAEDAAENSATAITSSSFTTDAESSSVVPIIYQTLVAGL